MKKIWSVIKTGLTWLSIGLLILISIPMIAAVLFGYAFLIVTHVPWKGVGIFSAFVLAIALIVSPIFTSMEKERLDKLKDDFWNFVGQIVAWIIVGSIAFLFLTILFSGGGDGCGRYGMYCE